MSCPVVGFRHSATWRFLYRRENTLLAIDRRLNLVPEQKKVPLLTDKNRTTWPMSIITHAWKLGHLVESICYVGFSKTGSLACISLYASLNLFICVNVKSTVECYVKGVYCPMQNVLETRYTGVRQKKVCKLLNNVLSLVWLEVDV